jgi:beta-lactamase class A
MLMWDTLVHDLNKRCDEQPFHTGWYLKDLRTGATADRHGQVVVPPPAPVRSRS